MLSDLDGAALAQQQQDALLFARVRALEQTASQLNGAGAASADSSAAAVAAASLAAMTQAAAYGVGGSAGGGGGGGSGRVPCGLTRTQSSPLPLQVLHQQSLWLQRQNLGHRAAAAADYGQAMGHRLGISHAEPFVARGQSEEVSVVVGPRQSLLVERASQRYAVVQSGRRDRSSSTWSPCGFIWTILRQPTELSA